MSLDLNKATKCQNDIIRTYTRESKVAKILDVTKVEETDGNFRKIGVRTRVDLDWFNNPANIPIFDEFGAAIAKGEIKYLIEQVAKVAETSREVDRNEITPVLIKETMAKAFTQGDFILLVPISIQYDVLLKESRWGSIYDYNRNTFVVNINNIPVPILVVHEDFIDNKILGVNRHVAMWKARAFAESRGATVFAKVEVPSDDARKVEVSSWCLSKFEPVDTSLATILNIREWPLIEKIIGDFYFEFAQYNDTTILACGFVSPSKPNITTNPVQNERSRIEALQNMFRKLSVLPAYAVRLENPEPIKAQGSDFLVTALRVTVSKRDNSRITVEEVAKLIDENLPDLSLNEPL
jgi:hypothetical protein